MSKTSMCIRMLQILNTATKPISIGELAKLLDTNPRNIIEYKKELIEIAKENGIEELFDSTKTRGRSGGYKLNRNVMLPSFTLTDSETESIFEATNYLMAKKDFLEKKEYRLAIGKIISSLVVNDVKQDADLIVIDRFPLSMSEEDIEYRKQIIKSAIKSKKRIVFTYLNQKNETKTHNFDPYELIQFNNAWFVIGWLNSKNHPGTIPFKLNRIQDIKITDENFRVWIYYNRNNIVDEYGFKNDGEWEHVEFIAYGNYASLCKERIYGKNQFVETIDENSTKVNVDMRNKESIRVFVLGFGKNIKVIKPKWLIDDLLSISKHIQNSYTPQGKNDSVI